MHLEKLQIRGFTRDTIILVATLIACAFAPASAFAQSKQYQRKQKSAEPSPTAAPAGAPATSTDATGTKPGTAPVAAEKSEKLDISELEQKYWAPKDTDFSVVQNRTYTKANRYAVSLLGGPIVNDPYNSGFSVALAGNYYFNERYGVELQYIDSSGLKDSDAVEEFCGLSGGCVLPDFNRPVTFYGAGFNWVPIYAKMSLLGSRIIYFDMQFTPILGMSTYEQQNNIGAGKEKTAFTYGIDVTQYFFFDKNLALRFNLQNRWSKQDIIEYDGTNKVRTDNDHTALFLFGLTYFH
jgi:outer membrane beta-barrel protein